MSSSMGSRKLAAVLALCAVMVLAVALPAAAGSTPAPKGGWPHAARIVRLAEYMGVGVDYLEGLVQEGYTLRQIAVAHVLSSLSGTGLVEVLGMKGEDVTWGQVADELGVDKAEAREALRELHDAVCLRNGIPLPPGNRAPGKEV